MATFEEISVLSSVGKTISSFDVFDEAEKKSPTDGFNPSIDDGIPSKDDSI